MNLSRSLQRLATTTAKFAWPVVKFINERFEQPSIHPKWAPAPLLKRRERTKPPLGWPRETDSLCPRCVKEVRDDILSGKRSMDELYHGKPGEIRATIVEENGQIVMKKTCATHGEFVDLMSIDPAWLSMIEQKYPGRDFLAPKTKLREHGSSSIQYGRGSVLTVDLTNRCNMMCDPCYMDANQVGYVHELTWEDIKKILDDAVTIQPRRQLSVQFAGGEPTLSPYFLEAIAYAKKIGYFSIQAATNGIRFATEDGFAQKARDAGLRIAYLQFDGTSNEKNQHRKIGNLFDVKLRTIEEMAKVGIDVVPVVTIVNGVNNDQVGDIMRFAIENADKITVVSFQPVSFTGRDEEISDERRVEQRYTLSHLAHDFKKQLGKTEPMRDWFPLSAIGPFSDLVDQLMGKDADWGSLKCGCHPNCGIGTILFVNKKTKQMIPLCEFLDMNGLLEDIGTITDASFGRNLTVAELTMSLLKNFNPDKAPPGYTFLDLVKQFTSQTGAKGKKIGETTGDANEYEWRVMFITGMWFQDLFNYDFRRTEMCIIPYGTQEGEISFCAYNTGVGWRQIVETMYKTASVADWYKEKGRHPIYAKGQDLKIPEFMNPITAKINGQPIRLKVLGQTAVAHDVGSKVDGLGAIPAAPSASTIEAMKTTEAPTSSLAANASSGDDV